MGDSPELMPLDSSLFNDLIEGIGSNVCATGAMERGMGYSMGTPNDAWKAMTAVWKTTPSSARIVEDVDRFLIALERIIEEEGAYVEEFDARKGHRRATQKTIKGGALFLTAGGCLTPTAMEAMRELLKSWEGLTRAI
jgi:hypothetical protein